MLVISRLRQTWWSWSPESASQILAEKSAAPVAARKAGLSSFADHTAPLCPSNVPTQSPVSPRRSIGLLSRHAYEVAVVSTRTSTKMRTQHVPHPQDDLPDIKKTPSGVGLL